MISKLLLSALVTLIACAGLIACGDAMPPELPDAGEPGPDADCDVVVGDVCYVCACDEDPATQTRPCAAWCADQVDEVDAGDTSVGTTPAVPRDAAVEQLDAGGEVDCCAWPNCHTCDPAVPECWPPGPNGEPGGGCDPQPDAGCAS